MPPENRIAEPNTVRQATPLTNKHFSKNNINLYPNPAVNLLNIDLGETQITDLILSLIHI